MNIFRLVKENIELKEQNDRITCILKDRTSEYYDIFQKYVAIKKDNDAIMDSLSQEREKFAKVYEDLLNRHIKLMTDFVMLKLGGDR